MHTSKNFSLQYNIHPEKHTQNSDTAHKVTTLLEATPRNKMRNRRLPEAPSQLLPYTSREGAFPKHGEPESDLYHRRVRMSRDNGEDPAGLAPASGRSPFTWAQANGMCSCSSQKV